MSENNELLQNQAKLAQKMAKVMAQMSRLPKTGHNKHQNYKFVTDVDVLDFIRPLLVEAGLAFFPMMAGVDIEQLAKGVHIKARFEFMFMDTETGFSISLPWYGECIEHGDKGISKAATSALKYFLLKTFMISTGDEKDDSDYHDDKNQRRQSSSPRQQSPELAQPITPPPAKQEAPATPKGTNGKQQHIWTIQGYSFTELMTATAFIIENNQHRANTIWKLHDTGELERTTLVQATEAVRAYANQGRVTMP